MLAETAKFSSEGLMKAWFSGGTQGADWFQTVMGGLFAKAGGADNAKGPSQS
jgi:hypothetical protein